MSKIYSLNELEIILFFIKKYGHLTYIKASALEDEYYQLTGVHRVGGALYMTAWRLEKGYYDHLLSVSTQ